MKGRRITYSAEELALVESLSSLPRDVIHAELVATFGRYDVTVDHIKSLCSRKGWATRDRFTDAEDAYIRAHFPHGATEQVAAAIGRTASSVSQRARRLGVEKDPAYLATAGRIQPGERRGVGTEFRKGAEPFNKGVKRGKGWAPGRMREGQFKPGMQTKNWKPVGTMRIVSGYWYTKVSDIPRVVHTVNWKPTHVLNWEAVHGPLPEGHCLKSRDGNSLNADATNWEAVPRAILPRLNGGRASRLSYDQAPDELKPVLMTVAKLQHAAKRRREAVHP
jgi:hypothetical protein